LQRFRCPRHRLHPCRRFHFHLCPRFQLRPGRCFRLRRCQGPRLVLLDRSLIHPSCRRARRRHGYRSSRRWRLPPRQPRLSQRRQNRIARSPRPQSLQRYHPMTFPPHPAHRAVIQRNTAAPIAPIRR
jgi:hypothetical protein